jgi:hypothetical protein
VVDTELVQAGGTAGRDAAVLMVERIESTERVTVAGDNGYDTGFCGSTDGHERDVARSAEPEAVRRQHELTGALRFTPDTRSVGGKESGSRSVWLA